MRAKLRIRFVVFEKALAMQILDQPEEWRKENSIGVVHRDITIRVVDHPFINGGGVWLRGREGYADNKVVVTDAADPISLRDKYVKAITEFVNHMDGPMVDVSGLVIKLTSREPWVGEEAWRELKMAREAIEAWASSDTKFPTVNGDVWEW